MTDIQLIGIILIALSSGILIGYAFKHFTATRDKENNS